MQNILIILALYQNRVKLTGNIQLLSLSNMLVVTKNRPPGTFGLIVL